MSIEEFKSRLKDGYRPNKFRVRIGVLGENFEFMCKGAQLPGRTIGTVEAKHQGRTVKVKGDPTFEEVTFTIYTEEKLDIWKKINAWMIAMDNVAGGAGDVLSIIDYKVEGVIYALDGNGDEVHADTLIGMWPSALQPLDLNWETVDTIGEFTATFSYDYHVPSSIEAF